MLNFCGEDLRWKFHCCRWNFWIKSHWLCLLYRNFDALGYRKCANSFHKILISNFFHSVNIGSITSTKASIESCLRFEEHELAKLLILFLRCVLNTEVYQYESFKLFTTRTHPDFQTRISPLQLTWLLSSRFKSKFFYVCWCIRSEEHWFCFNEVLID